MNLQPKTQDALQIPSRPRICSLATHVPIWEVPSSRNLSSPSTHWLRPGFRCLISSQFTMSMKPPSMSPNLESFATSYQVLCLLVFCRVRSCKDRSPIHLKKIHRKSRKPMVPSSIARLPFVSPASQGPKPKNFDDQIWRKSEPFNFHLSP